MEDPKPWSDYSVPELKEALRTRSMPVSGRKDVLIDRLENSVFDADIIEKSPEDRKIDFLGRVRSVPLSTLIVVSVLLVGGSGGAIILSLIHI